MSATASGVCGKFSNTCSLIVAHIILIRAAYGDLAYMAVVSVSAENGLYSETAYPKSLIVNSISSAIAPLPTLRSAPIMRLALVVAPLSVRIFNNSLALSIIDRHIRADMGSLE